MNQSHSPTKVHSWETIAINAMWEEIWKVWYCYIEQSHSPTKVHSCKTIAINVRRSRKGLKCLRVISEVTLNQTRSSIHQSPQLGQFGGYSGNFINACLWPELPTHFISWNYDHDDNMLLTWQLSMHSSIPPRTLKSLSAAWDQTQIETILFFFISLQTVYIIPAEGMSQLM